MVAGTEEERIGLVSKALLREQVLEESPRVAHGLATGPQLAIRLTKRALNSWLRTAGPVFEQSAAYEMLTVIGEDGKEGAAGLSAKRPPALRSRPGRPAAPRWPPPPRSAYSLSCRSPNAATSAASTPR